MKNSKILVLVLFLFSIGCIADKETEKEEINNDLTEMNLKGNVKMLKEISYKAVDSFGEIKKAEPFREFDYGIEKDFIIVFNNDGKKMFESHYREGETLLARNEFIYNDEGLLVKDVEYESDGKKHRELIYKYDENGFLIEDYSFRFDYNPEGSLSWASLYTNDSAGRNIAETFILGGEVHSRTIYEYDSFGNMSSRKHLNKPFDNYDDLKDHWTYKYNFDGKITERKRYKYQDRLERTFTYEYNDYGDCIEENHIDYSDPRAISGDKEKKRYEYEYDSKKNWTKKIEFRNNLPQFIFEREIEYFD